VQCRQRPSDPWFDKDCRQAKRVIRRLARAASAASKRDDGAAVAVAHSMWIAQRRTYRALLRSKREAFWQSSVSLQQKSPHALRNTINNLLGRVSVPPQDTIGADVFHRFFDD
jgi:hypothetical protein